MLLFYLTPSPLERAGGEVKTFGKVKGDAFK